MFRLISEHSKLGVNKIKDLIRKSKKGDREAFMALIDRQQNMLYHTAMVILKNEDDVLDAMQDTILSCWENLPNLKKDSYFKTWLTRILLNKCYDCLRVRNHFSDSEEFPESGEETDWDTSMDVGRAMCRLSRDDRVILSLFYYDDFSTRQIAQALSISESAVRTRLSRSRSRFKKIYLQEEENDEKRHRVPQHYRG